MSQRRHVLLLRAVKEQLSLKAKPLTFGLVGALVVGIFFVDPLIRLGPTVGILYAIPIAVIGLWSSSKESRLVLLTASTCTVLLFMNLFIGSPRILHDDLANRLLSLVVIWGITGAAVARKRMLQEVKLLRGLLTMCSYCRRVRDANDQWTTLERLISSHTEADFSHGLCPDCLSVHFPECVGENGAGPSRKMIPTRASTD